MLVLAFQAGDASVQDISQHLWCQASSTCVPSFPELLGLVGSGTARLFILLIDHF